MTVRKHRLPQNLRCTNDDMVDSLTPYFDIESNRMPFEVEEFSTFSDKNETIEYTESLLRGNDSKGKESDMDGMGEMLVGAVWDKDKHVKTLVTVTDVDVNDNDRNKGARDLWGRIVHLYLN